MLYCNTDLEHYDRALENAKGDLMDMHMQTRRNSLYRLSLLRLCAQWLKRTPEAIQKKFEQARALAKDVPGIDKDIANAYNKMEVITIMLSNIHVKI